MTATTGFKRFIAAVAALATAGVIGLSFAAYLVSADAAGDAVLAEVKAATGFEPTARGPATLAVFPSPHVSLGDVALAGPGGGAPPLTAERLVAYLRWLPLLSGRFEIADLGLERPRIALSVDADGHSNWSPLLDILARTVRSGAAVGAQTLSFSEIRISDGVVQVEDAARGFNETLKQVELSLAWPSIAKRFAATGSVAWRNQPLDVAVSISDFPAALAGDNAGLKFRIAGAPLKLAFDGTMSHRPSVKIDGALAADAASLRNAMSWASGKPTPGVGLGRFALKARTNVMGGTVSLSNLNIELDGNVAEGVLSYAARERPTLQGTLAVDALDLTPYGSALRLLANDARAWNGKPIALDWFDAVDFDLRISAARVIAAQTRFGRTAGAATLRDGRLVVTVGESQGFNGLINGSLAIAKTDDGGHLRSQVNLTNVDLEACLAELFGVRRLEGKGTLSLILEGHGPSVLGLARTLNGSATLTATQGALVGFNVEQLLRRLERRPLAGNGDFRTGRTPFGNLDVAVKIAHGAAKVEQVRLEGTNVRLALAGNANVPSRDLDLNGTASLLAAADAGPVFELPFFVQGSWDDPVMLPDTQALIRRSGAAAPLLESVIDQRARDSVRSAIDRMIGDAAQKPAPRRDGPTPIPFDPPPQAKIAPTDAPAR